jgi:AAA+ ATPase superfamily predicted ATPase
MAEASPFKFLDPYDKEDQDRFFGRDRETEDLYEMSFRTNLMLVYGASGTGKTSIMKCGVANRFSPTSWQEIYIQRKGNHLLEAVRQAIHEVLEPVAFEGVEISDDLPTAIGQLYRLTATPTYLIFDQFEELLISGTEEERKAFFSFLAKIVEPEARLSCKAILIMREEFIASCWNYERLVPSLFEHRYRIEKMRPDSQPIHEVIEGTLQQLPEIQLQSGTTELIIKRLAKGKVGLELTYLQVYLDRLYRQAEAKRTNGKLIFSPELVNSLGEIEDVIGDFLDEQLRALEAKLPPERRAIPLQLLSAFVTDERTKQVVTEEDLLALKDKYELTDEEYELCLSTFDRMQIIRYV